ncbi:hypothetical protein PINS_up004804 [Pythium insidiosum]|nr:hypothetical protein PINS_up004804 [Pythium insidiosum]
MRLRLTDDIVDDEDGDVCSHDALNETLLSQRQSRSLAACAGGRRVRVVMPAADPFAAPASHSSKRLMGRMRAPSLSDDSTDEDDDEHKSMDDVDDDADETSCHGGVDREDLLRHVEQSCERRAARAVSSSAAYQALCETLKAARLDAARQLERLAPEPVDKDPAVASILRRHTQVEARTLQQLSERHSKERSVVESVENELAKYRKASEAARRAEEERRRRAAEAEREAEEARQQKLQAQREQEKQADDARRARLEAERKKKEEADQEAAAEAAAKKKAEDDAKKKAEAAKHVAQLSKEHVEAAALRLKRLEELQRLSDEILNDPNASIKALRVEIKRQAGACNQISAAPSAIRAVVDKIQSLMQTARGHSEQCFKYALNVVAGNLTKQARVVLDYKACYPLAYVIKMACVQTPELSDVLLAYFNQMCMYTVPESRKKRADQSVKEYKMSIGFEEAVDAQDGKKKADSDGLEHVAEYSRRMSMICAALAAVMQTTPWTPGASEPPGLGIQDCWAWLARLVNDQPELLTGPILLAILEVAGFELLRHYKTQFHKLLMLIAKDVLPRLNKTAGTGAANAAVQLEMFIKEYQSNNCSLREPEARKLEETKVSAADEERTEDGGGGGGYGGGGYGGGGRFGGGGRGGGGRFGGRGRGRGR